MEGGEDGGGSDGEQRLAACTSLHTQAGRYLDAPSARMRGSLLQPHPLTTSVSNREAVHEGTL